MDHVSVDDYLAIPGACIAQRAIKRLHRRTSKREKLPEWLSTDCTSQDDFIIPCRKFGTPYYEIIM